MHYDNRSIIVRREGKGVQIHIEGHEEQTVHSLQDWEMTGVCLPCINQ